VAKKAKARSTKKSLKPRDLAPRGGSAKIKGGAVGPCFGKIKGK
jgi:hypothetical protein